MDSQVFGQEMWYWHQLIINNVYLLQTFIQQKKYLPPRGWGQSLWSNLLLISLTRICLFGRLRIKARASCMLGRHFSAEVHFDMVFIHELYLRHKVRNFKIYDIKLFFLIELLYLGLFRINHEENHSQNYCEL